jgi:hypothetical protein
MTNFTVTIDANFTSGATMSASHWSGAVDDIETLLQGVVGRDGSGIDNWNGNEALRGQNFRKGGLVSVFRHWEAGPVVVVPDPNLTTGAGITPSTISGGCLRFFLNGNAKAVWIHFQARAVFAANSGQSFQLQRSWDYNTLGTRTAVGSCKAGNPTSQSTALWTSWVQTTALNVGWHSVEHWIADAGGTPQQIVLSDVETWVVAAYQ